MLTAEDMLDGYRRGIFPMAKSRRDPQLHWVDPAHRGIFDLQEFNISRSLSRRIRSGIFTISTNLAFSAVVSSCAARPETWINEPLHHLYADLNRMGHAHSLEVWQGDVLVGGVFGLTIGAAFFGESMFSIRTDASKVALAYLVDRLRVADFRLFDTQFLTPHLASLGAIEIARDDYHRRLDTALSRRADFALPSIPTPQLLMQRSTQTS